MHLRSKVVAAVLLLCVVLGTCWGLYYYTSVRIDTSTIEYIESMQKGPNDFLDLANDINVESADDIGYVVEGNYHINIHYGDQVIEMNRNCFSSDSYKAALAQIGIEVKFKENDDGTVKYRVTYWDTPVTQLSLVS